MPDKFAATWVSHSSMSDFLKCPRAYYLNNVYKDPKTQHKIQLIAAPLALGQAVHEVLESLSLLPAKERFSTSLIDRFDKTWKKVSGKQGGFTTESQEQDAKRRGEDMLRRVMENPGPLLNLSVKIKSELPQYWLSEEDEIILCGKVDWLEFLPDQDAVHVIDFKTSKRVEDGSSLQLPIYHLLVHNTQHRKVAKASYWYLALDEQLVEKELPDLEEAHESVLEVAKRIKLQRKLGVFKCPNGDAGCFACKPLEKIIKGEAEYVGVSSIRQDMYMLKPESTDLTEQSELI